MIFVTDAAGATALDTAAIAAGTPSRALMQRAGAAAATEIGLRLSDRLAAGVAVFTGSGNNGGDGWVVARALHAAGVHVRVIEIAEPRTDDARAERALAIADGVTHGMDATHGANATEAVIVDALLGTGLSASEPLRGAIGDAVRVLHAHRARGATIVSIDIPSGLDASSGRDAGAVQCALTLTFGSVKRGQLMARGLCGQIVALDIGLAATASHGRHVLATPAWFAETVPPIAADAHKGTRGKVAILGGADGMGGAVALAARGALRSGAGMVKCIVANGSLAMIRERDDAVLTGAWPECDAEFVDTAAWGGG
ncbi:MAG: NAD(P)H-hydrate epimerase, partial [Gemmatimonadaceae bacterium]|nr:NAD(P)H-hydrate epimerase [Gemmatimonadaceae bacterium]